MFVEGLIGHDPNDTPANNTGFLQGGIDWETQKRYQVNYDAGGDIVYYEVDDQSGIPAAGIRSMKDVSQEAYDI